MVNNANTSNRQKLMEWLKIIGLIILIFAFVRFFIGRPIITNGNSMSPTLTQGDNIFLEKTSYFFSSPKKGQIIVFPYPKDVTKAYIKRVIGVPGDVISIRNHYFYINDVKLVDDFSGKITIMGDTVFPLTVGKDKYFVLGDNRGVSRDSRFSEVGLIDKKDIIGRAILCYYPFNHLKILK